MGECPWETNARKEVSLGEGGTRIGDARWEKVRLVVVRDNKLVMQRVLEKRKIKYGQKKSMHASLSNSKKIHAEFMSASSAA